MSDIPPALTLTSGDSLSKFTEVLALGLHEMANLRNIDDGMVDDLENTITRRFDSIGGSRHCQSFSKSPCFVIQILSFEILKYG